MGARAAVAFRHSGAARLAARALPQTGSLALTRDFRGLAGHFAAARRVLVLTTMPTRSKVTRIRVPAAPVSETHPRVRQAPLDADAEALLLVAKTMHHARVATGVAKIAFGMLAGVATRKSAAMLQGPRVERVVSVARAAAQAASHVAAQRVVAAQTMVASAVAASNDDHHLDEEDRASCVDVA